MKKLLLPLLPLLLFASNEPATANMHAIIMFIAFVAFTLVITWWAARRTRTAKDFYTAGGGITGFQNSLAIAGDYMSAASFLGITGMVYMKGYDGLIYSIGFLVGWPVILFLMAERLRNLGKFNFSDVVAYRLKRGPIRTMAAFGSLAVVMLYLIAQMVGAGALIQVLFGLDYSYAVVIVGVLIILYVTFGGMLATTWVQIIKAVLLLFGVSLLAILALKGADFSIEKFFNNAIEARGSSSIMGPGSLDAINAISLGLALMLGTAGLPHILMRFFTVGDAKEARKSVFYATGFIGYFYILTFIIGFGAIIYLTGHSEYMPDGKALAGGSNMAAVHLSHALGGNIFLGFISAVAFATILAVVSGLTLAAANAIAHDLYAQVYKKGQCSDEEEMKMSRYSTFGMGILAIVLGIIFEGQNVAFMVGLAFAIAASANFPALILSMYWKRLTTKGAVWGGSIGLATAVALLFMSPAIMVDILHYEKALIGLNNPAIISVPVAFIATYIFSKLDNSQQAKDEAKMFDELFVRSETGIGAESASSH